ncbi:hypothetical protein [Mycobacterium sp. AZCC_0083]|uniref:hypothetical protein n=1 Tax=Mycobacterium sp. AZCC_0083 TaxID=2735882 RepID=UPI001615664D|nr:hypothetical protein [Mycobacterium sp. AZCC_0083]MBB5167193.1 hypothetical protein [Mycobacterium sp. AZCC_0083]
MTLPAPIYTDTVRLADLYEPIIDTMPSSEIVTDAYSTSAQTMDSLVGVPWNTAGKFNTQGQNWQFQTPGNWAGGAKNDTSARASGGSTFNMSTRFEFVYTGDKLDLMFLSTGAFDCQVYVEHNGRMVKLQDKPLGTSLTGYVFRSIKFATPGVARSGYKKRRIRVHVAGNVNFLQVNIEAAALMYAAPARPMVIFDGDSYFEPLHNQNVGSDETYFSYGPQDAFFEATGIVHWNAAQGGTGFFQNGDTVARTDDTPSSINSTRIGSASRKTTIANGFAIGAADPMTGISFPVAYILHGTVNDAAVNPGGTAAMKARAKVVYNEALALDSNGLMTFIHVGNEPYTIFGTSPASYVSGGANDLNRQGHIAAIAEVARAFYVDPANPTNPWWTGNGGNNNSLTDQQALITGADNLHGNYRGYFNHGRRIADAIRHIPVPAVRAYRVG